MPSLEENRRFLDQESDAGDYHETVDRFNATLDMVADLLAALEAVLGGIQTDSAQQVYITGDHFALTVEDARAIAAAHQGEGT